MDVGYRIKQLREQKNYTINKLANMAGVSQSYLRDVELDNKNPTIAFLTLICEALDISLQDFFSEPSQSGILNDPILQSIYKLSSEQKNALLVFLKAMQND